VVLSLFILLVGCAAFFPPAVSAVEKTVGVIIPDIPFYRDIHNSFMARLSREDHGGRVEVITQRPYPDPISLSNAARKLIALDVDVIVAYGAPAALAAYREKTKIPVVYAVVYEPIASKIKAKNVTGVTSRVSISSLLRYLRGMSAITSLGVIYSSNEEDSLYQLKEVQNLSNQYGFKVEEINLKRPQDAQAALSGRKVDAIFVTGSSVASMTSSTIMEYAGEHRIPTASMIPAKSPPAIITLSSGPKDQGEKAADMVMKILGGVAPEKIKADSSGDVELVFNLREAKERGYKIPMDLITESTRLIQ
jgi:putative ABC transport system substrate-binding protein